MYFNRLLIIENLMVKKPRMVRTFARTATKHQEKQLIENAKKLYQDPLVILPEGSAPSCEKHLGKIRNKLEKTHRFRDNTKKLEKLSKKKGLDGALAGTLLLVEAKKAPYLAVAKFQTGDIVYAKRGNADREKLIAVQHFDNPVLRLLGLKETALKKGLYVYSWDKGYICTGSVAQPPSEFITFSLKKLGLSQQKKGCSCEHIPLEKAVKQSFLKKYYLRIHWKSADKIIAVCEDCAKTRKNTVFELSKYLLEPDLTEDFDVAVVAQVVKDHETTDETMFLDEYFVGKLTDHQLITKNVQHQKKTLQESSEKLFVLDGVSYGTDVQGFLDALKPNKVERAGLEHILDKIDEPLVLSKATPHTILERYWDDYGEDVINSVIDDEDMATSFFHLDDTPSNILAMVFDYKKRQRILAELPQYKKLPPLARFADHIARTYRTFGEKKTLLEIKKRPNSPKAKSLAYAFLLVFDKGKESKWQFSPVEVEYGEFLKEYAQKLLDASPKQYSQALQELLTASGSGETIPTDSSGN